ncbi:MAG: hypothetical protein ACOC9J_01490 [Persicimonas sp.]
MLISLIALEKRQTIAAIAVLVALGLLLGATATALAIKPEKKFKGEIIISTERFPSRFKSDNHFVGHMKKAKTKTLVAEDEDDWTFHYMSFLPESVSTLKAAVTYYDVTNPGQKKMINTFAFYPGEREDKILAGFAELSMDKFETNRKYLMVFSRGYGQEALAKTHFTLKRKGEKKDDGVVDFTGKKKKKKKDD